jgi:RimJ/RimL family protein N-acetyltransferase
MHLTTGLPDCVLRPWRREDKPALLQHANNRKVWRNLTAMFPHPYTEADADQWFAIASAPGNSIHLAIEWGGQAVGGIGVIAGEGIGYATGQFGYWLGEALWGRGIATAAVRALADHALARPRFARLEARVFAWNPASMRVLEKAGFAREGVLRHSAVKDGQIIDCVMYAKVRHAPARPAAEFGLTLDDRDADNPAIVLRFAGHDWVCDAYHLALDRKPGDAPDVRAVLRRLLAQWLAAAQALKTGETVWLPYDFSDHHTGWLRCARTPRGCVVTQGRAGVEGWRISPSDIGDLTREPAGFEASGLAVEMAMSDLTAAIAASLAA